MSEKVHPSVQILWDRKREESKPWNRTDGAKVGLVVEGGALRGVVSASILVAMLNLGLKDSIDVIYGESVGSGNGAWFLSGQLPKTIEVYWSVINNLSYLNPLKIFNGGIVNNKFLREQIETNYPIDFSALVDSGVILNILVARVDKPNDNPLIALSKFDDQEDFYNASVGAVHMPFFCGKPYQYKDMKIWDAGILDKFPIQTAIEDGCTHILAISSSPYDYAPKDHNVFDKLLIPRYFNRYNPKIGEIYMGTKLRYKDTLDELRAKHESQNGSPYIATLALPKGSERLHSFEMNTGKLLQAAWDAEQQTYKDLRAA